MIIKGVLILWCNAMTLDYTNFDSIFLSIFPTSITRKDFESRTIDDTMDRFTTDFFYPYVGPYVSLSQPDRDVTIEILVDFPWDLLVERKLVDKSVTDKTKSPKFTRQVWTEQKLMVPEDYKRLASQSFQNFAQEAVKHMQATPLQYATIVIDGFGVPKTINGNPNLTVRIASEYEVHTLTYDKEKRSLFKRDLIELAAIGREQQKPREYRNPVRNALSVLNAQSDCHNLDEPSAETIGLLSNLLGCSFSEIAITIDRVSGMSGSRLAYISAFNRANRAHMERFSPESAYAKHIIPALETMMARRTGKSVTLQTFLYN